MDSATKICDKIGVSREKALFFLEASQWDLNSAMKVCRDKILSDQQSPRTPPQQQPPLGIMPETEQQPQIMPAQQPRRPRIRIGPERRPPLQIMSQSREELIDAFCTVAAGTTPEDAEAYLEHCQWNVEEAIGSFMDRFRPIHGKSKPHRVSQVARSFSQDYQKYLGGSSKNFVPKIDYSALQELWDNPSMNFNRMQDQTGSSSSSMHTDQSPKEELFTVPVSLISSPKFNESRSSKVDTWIREETFTPPMDTWVDLICNETKVSRFEALYYLEGFEWNFGVAMEACRNKTFPPPVKETSLPGVSVSEISSEMITPIRSSNQLSDPMDQLYQWKLVDSFLEAVSGATREEAITCLQLSSWDVDQAVCYFLDRFSKEETNAAMTMWQLQASHGSQNQGYSNECVIGSSSSSVNAEDLTDTGLSLKEAGKEKATVASSQVDINLNDKAGKEDSSTETLPNPCALQDSITLELVLASGKSGTTVKIPFRSDQTVRDIREAIDKRTPDEDKEYSLLSTIGEDYSDMDTTVSKIISAGSGTLIQTFPDQ